jgi:hypothetical protein
MARNSLNQCDPSNGGNDVPRGTMDEVSSYVRLKLPLPRRQGRAKDCSTSVFESHHRRALVPSPKRSATHIDTGVQCLTPDGRLEKRTFPNRRFVPQEETLLNRLLDQPRRPRLSSAALGR